MPAYVYQILKGVSVFFQEVSPLNNDHKMRSSKIFSVEVDALNNMPHSNEQQQLPCSLTSHRKNGRIKRPVHISPYAE